MIYEKARKMLMTGLGFAAITKEKAEKVVGDLIKEGELSKDEGRELLDTWVSRIDQEKEEIRIRIQKEVKKVTDGAGLVSRDQISALEERIAKLEAKLNPPEDQSENS